MITNLNKNFIMMMCLFMSLVVVTSCGDDDDDGMMMNDPDPSSVVANFSSQVDADNSLVYSFTNNSVVNGITDTSFDSSWDFGGDGASTEASPTYTFSAEGTYEVTLTVTAADGETGTFSETIEVTAPKNRYAVIADLSDDDTGELRIAMDSIGTGRATFRYRVFADAADGFISISGTSTSGDDAIVEVRIKDNAPHEFREGASDDAVAAANFPEGVTDEWVDVEVSWAKSADGSTPPTFSVSMGGQTVITDAVSTTNGGDGDVPGHLEATKDGAHTWQWKYNSNSNTSEGVFQVDDIVIYSSDSGTETIMFEDNFQGWTAGQDLHPDVNLDSPYHPNSSEATVGQDD